MKQWLAVLSCIAASIAVCARADYLGTLGFDEDQFDVTQYYTVYIDSSGAPWATHAVRIVPTQDWTVPYVKVAMSRQSAQDALTIYIAADDSGKPGSAVLTVQSGATGWAVDDPQIHEYIPDESIVLSGGSTYWLVAAAPYAPFVGYEYRWYYNDFGLTGTRAVYDQDMLWTTTAGADLAGYAIPEPSTALLALLGLGLAGLRRRRG